MLNALYFKMKETITIGKQNNVTLYSDLNFLLNET